MVRFSVGFFGELRDRLVSGFVCVVTQVLVYLDIHFVFVLAIFFVHLVQEWLVVFFDVHSLHLVLHCRRVEVIGQEVFTLVDADVQYYNVCMSELCLLVIVDLGSFHVGQELLEGKLLSDVVVSILFLGVEDFYDGKISNDLLLTLLLRDIARDVSLVVLIGVLGGGSQETLLVDVKGDNNRSLTRWFQGNVLEFDLTQLCAIGCLFSLCCFSLDHSKVDSWLVIYDGRVFLLSSERKLGVLGDHNTHSVVVLIASDLNSEVQGGHIDDLGLSSSSISHLGAKKCGTVGNSLIGVNSVVKKLTTELLLQHLLDCWDS